MELSALTLRRSTIAVFAVAAVLVAAFPAFAQEETGEPPMDPMMAAIMKAGTPGDPHARLAAAAGKFTMVVRSWMDPANPEPTVMNGTVEREMIFDGRILRETAHSEFEGYPFEGMGLSGYDNVTGKYWATWNDNMSTSIYVAYGTADEDGRITFHGEYANPLDGSMVHVRSVVIPGEKPRFEWYETRGEGGEQKTMEIEYTRQ